MRLRSYVASTKSAATSGHAIQKTAHDAKKTARDAKKTGRDAKKTARDPKKAKRDAKKSSSDARSPEDDAGDAALRMLTDSAVAVMGENEKQSARGAGPSRAGMAKVDVDGAGVTGLDYSAGSECPTPTNARAPRVLMHWASVTKEAPAPSGEEEEDEITPAQAAVDVSRARRAREPKIKPEDALVGRELFLEGPGSLGECCG